MEGRSSCADCAPWAPSPNRPGRLRETPGGLTLARAHGYWKRCTLQKSSATATTRSLWERHRELMSVPSEPSGHTPSTVAGLSAASSLPPPTAQSCTVSQTPAAATTHRPRFRQPLPREGQGASGASWTGSSSFLMPTPPYTPSIPTPGWARPRPPPPPPPTHTHSGFHPAPLLTIDMEAQHASVGGPLPVSALIAIPQQLAASSHVPWGEGPHPAQPSPALSGEDAMW